MAKIIYGAYTKKRLLQLIKSLPENKVILVTNYFKSMSMSPGSGSKSCLTIQSQFPNEMFMTKGDIRQFSGAPAFTMLAVDEESLSEKYKNGLKDNDGIFGYQHDQP